MKGGQCVEFIRAKFVQHNWSDFDHDQMMLQVKAMEHVQRRSDPFDKLTMNIGYKELVEATRATMRDGWSRERFANTLQSFMSHRPECKDTDADYVNTMLVRGLRCAAEEQPSHQWEVKCEARASRSTRCGSGMLPRAERS